MEKKISIIAVILALVALGLAIFGLVSPAKTEAKTEPDVQYVMFVGTNDKDSYEPYGTPEEVKAKMDEVLTRHFEGFTIQDAMGGWTNENGTVDHEYTVVVLLSDTTADKVHAAADDLIREFNQSTILIQTNMTQTEFYSGGK